MSAWQCFLIAGLLVIGVLVANYIAVTLQERGEGTQPAGFTPEQVTWCEVLQK